MRLCNISLQLKFPHVHVFKYGKMAFCIIFVVIIPVKGRFIYILRCILWICSHRYDYCQTGQSVQALSRHYESRFLQALNRLNVLRPTLTHRVTDHIPPILRFIQTLVDNGHAYVTHDGMMTTTYHIPYREKFFSFGIEISLFR